MQINNSGMIGAITAAIFVPLVFAFLRKYGPKQDAFLNVQRMNSAEADGYEKKSVVLAFILVPTLGYFFYFLISLVSGFFYSNSETFVTSGKYVKVILAGCFAIGLMHYIYDFLGKLYLGDRYLSYVAAYNYKYGFNSFRVSLYLCNFVLIAGVVQTLLTIPCHIEFMEDRLVFRRWASFRKHEIKFGEIKEIKRASFLIAPNGNMVSRVNFLVKSNDGTELHSEDLPIGGDEKLAELVFSRISKESGKEISNVEQL